MIALLHLRDDDFDVLLPGARNQKFLGLGIAEKAQHGIFFHQFVDARAQLVFIRAALGLDRKRDSRLGQLHSRILDRRALVAQRVASQRVFQLGYRADISRVQFGYRHSGFALHDGNMRQLFLPRCG